MKATQNTIIANDRVLIQACPDRDISNRFEAFLKDDLKNLEIIDTAIVQYGIKAEPKPTTQKQIEEVEQMVKESDLSLFEKVAMHELLVHTQATAGLLVHKAGQVVGADIAVAIAPLNAVNFDNRGHEEQLKGVMESLSTIELTGMPSDNGLWSRVQDTIAALSGVAGGLISRADHEVGICDLVRQDHVKLNTLFSQIKATNDPAKLQEYFGQVYQDITAHSEAKTQVLYPAVRSYYNDIQKLHDQQSEVKVMLERVKAMNPEDTVEFKAASEQLMNAVAVHIRDEQEEMFPRIKESLGDEQQKNLANEFKKAKSEILDKRMAASSK